MKDIETICPNPGCDKDIVLEGSKIKRAILRKKDMGGKALIGCPYCGIAMKLPDDLPKTDALFDQYVEAHDDTLECIASLDPSMVKLPVGSKIIAGTLMFKNGAGTGFYDKYTYMVKFGIDPSIVIYKSSIKPFVIKG